MAKRTERVQAKEHALRGDQLAQLDLVAIERELFKRRFRDYVPDAFEVSEGGDLYAAGVRAGKYPARYSGGWHIDAIADHLDAVRMGHIRFLLINIPPGTMKSVEASVLWPTQLWANDPAMRFMFSSYSEEFTKRDTRRAKELVQSAWYQARFPDVQLKVEPDTMMEHHTTAGGMRIGASTNSGVTGKHVHGILEDDPIKAQDAQSERARKEAWDYRTHTLGSRLLPEAGWRVLIMQRLHEDDPSGRILAANKASPNEDGYVHLMLPMELEAKRKCATYVKGVKFFEDPRKEEGELLWPKRMGPQFIEEKKSPSKGLGAYAYAGQYQQRPAPAVGSIIQRDWLRYYSQSFLTELLLRAQPKADPRSGELIPSDVLLEWEQSWDLIFDGDGVGSFVCGQTWVKHGSNHYLVHQYRERVDFTETVRAFAKNAIAYPMALRKKVEKKANGAALISVLGDKIGGITAWPPKGTALKSKGARMVAVSPLFEAGNVWVPMVAEQPWVESWIEEVVGMTPEGPSTANDDQADATTQYLSDKGFALPGTKMESITIDLDVGTLHGQWEERSRGSSWEMR